MNIKTSILFKTQLSTIIFSFLGLYIFVFVFYFIFNELRYQKPLLSLIAALIGFLLVVISIYYLLFLIRFGKPYLRISKQRFEVRTLFHHLDISLEDIAQTNIQVEDINFFQATVILHLDQKHIDEKLSLTQQKVYQHHAISLFFLPKDSHFQAVTLLSILYALPLFERDLFIQSYHQNPDFDFSNFLSLEQRLELDLLGYLLISSQQNHSLADHIENL